jgi:predicted permease
MSRRDPIADDVRDELQEHLQSRIDDNLARGLSPEDARREALGRFGSIERTARRSVRIRHREIHPLRGLSHDARQAWRAAWRRHPLATCAAVGVAALGLTTSLAALRVADGLVDAPAGLRRPAELRSLLETFQGRAGSRMTFGMFTAVARDVADAQPAVWDHREFQIRSASAGRVRPGAVVSGSYFSTLGTRPAAGRLLTPLDDEQGAAVAVVSDRLARTIAPEGGSVGTRITVNGQSVEIVGVTPPGFVGLRGAAPEDVWLPLSLEPRISSPTIFPDGHVVQGYRNTPGIGFLEGVVRVDGARDAETRSRLTAAIRSATTSPTAEEGAWLTDRPWLTPFSDSRRAIESAARSVFWSGVLTLLLSGACIGSLFVGRLTDRLREFGLCLALGATRWRIVRACVVDIALVLGMAALVALPLAVAVLARAASLHVTGAISVGDVLTGVDAVDLAWPLAGLAGVLSVMVAVVSAGIVAGARPTARDSSSRVSAHGTRLRRALLAAQVASGCALISGALMLTASVDRLRDRPLGFDADRVAFAEVDPAGAGIDADGRAVIRTRLLDAPWPGDVDGAYANEVPFVEGNTLFVAGEGSSERQYPVARSRVSARYFDVLGIPILAGRAFEPTEMERAVAIVSEPLARMYWPDGSALGRRVLVGGVNGVPHEIVGIVAGARDLSLRGEPTARLYLPYGAESEGLTLVVRHRTAGRSADLPSVAAAVASGLDARLVVGRTGLLKDLAWRAIEQRLLLRFVTLVVGAGSLAMVAVGVWGLSHATLRRRLREFGIRQALGGPPREAARRAMTDAFSVALAGGALGVAAGWQLGVILQSMLYGVSPSDPVRIGVGTGVVMVAAVAGAVPSARRAARVDPSRLLRED